MASESAAGKFFVTWCCRQFGTAFRSGIPALEAFSAAQLRTPQARAQQIVVAHAGGLDGQLGEPRHVFIQR
ncbi:hypothetical protein AB0D57_29865 [Streptomyces sp. NPDC048275]|uniref:hypothetical protein n=1 Tax=Streptomyces sp. NPDC048275 TaxID=3155629 RepID=UPI0033E3CB7C